MKNILIVIGLAAIIIAILPAIQRDAPSSATAEPQGPAPTFPAPLGSSLDRPAQPFQSTLGTHHGGLGSATMTQGPAGSAKVYTLKSLPREADEYNGQVVQLRFSRPLVNVIVSDGALQPIEFSDRDNSGAAKIFFPPEGAARLDLLGGRSQPGLTFYVALESTGLRAVGREWRADSRTYVW